MRLISAVGMAAGWRRRARRATITSVSGYKKNPIPRKHWRVRRLGARYASQIEITYSIDYIRELIEAHRSCKSQRMPQLRKATAGLLLVHECVRWLKAGAANLSLCGHG